MLNQKLSFHIGWPNLISILLAAFFFSYLGNLFSLKSIKLATNPGYSLIISKSYVVFTSIAAIFLFNSPLTPKNALAIAIIVLFSGLIMINKTKTSAQDRKTNINWLIFALGAFFAWGGLALISKYWLNIGIPIATRLFYLSTFVSAMILVEIFGKHQNLKISRHYWFLIIFIGILSMFFNLFMQIGYQYAPNPGYINAVNASSISLLTLLAAYFFKDELSLRKIAGVLGVTAGLVLLFM
jgi:drug/metabolite transporter (DMT)-like permease